MQEAALREDASLIGLDKSKRIGKCDQAKGWRWKGVCHPGLTPDLRGGKKSGRDRVSVPKIHGELSGLALLQFNSEGGAGGRRIVCFV